jgi:uncharacterized membrane protein
MTNEEMKDQPITMSSNMLAVAGILLGTILMLGGARGDLWLDEIWSVMFAETARTPWEIFTVFRHDNNHVLNTLYLYAIGKQQYFILYRALSIMSGIGSLVVLRKIASRWGRMESVLVVLFAGTSYPLLLYFSEARGYAPAIFFGLLSFFLVQECQRRYHPVKLILFWCASILGVLSHLTFVIVLVSLGIYVVHREFSADAPFMKRSLQAAKYLAVPVVFLFVFYLLYARGMTMGGGPDVDKYFVLLQGLAALLGLPDAVSFLAIPAITLLVLWSLYLLLREGDREWSFYISVLIISPALAVILAGRQSDI